MNPREGHLQMAILGHKRDPNSARSFEPACGRLIPAAPP